MANITVFSKGTKGSVAIFQDPTIPASVTFRMDGWQGFNGFKSIVTRVAVSSSCNFQVLHTLGGDAFIYVFGDRVGQIIVSGLAFEMICDAAAPKDGEPAAAAAPPDKTGIELVRDYYKQNRLVTKKTPINMTIGSGLTLKMYLGGLNLDVEDAANKIWRFSMVLVEVPEALPKLADEGGGSSSSSPKSSSSGSSSGKSGSTSEQYSRNMPAAGSDQGGNNAKAAPQL